MPTYEYECLHCGHTFEARQKISDKPLASCPKCHNKVKKLISSGIGIIVSSASKKEPGICPKAKEGCHGCQPN